MTIFFRHSKRPMMIAVGGLSGSGKSTLAEELGRRIPNSVVLDSDVVHKQLRGVDPTTPLPDHAYTPTNIKSFIRHIHREAEKHMQEGKTVIVTGTFLDKQTRLKQEFLARRNDAEFIGIYLHASASVLFERVAKRKDSASDADRSVLQRQFKALQDEKRRESSDRLKNQGKPPNRFKEMTWQIINADQPIGDMVKRAVLYIHQEHQRAKYRPQPKRTRKGHITPVLPQP